MVRNRELENQRGEHKPCNNSSATSTRTKIMNMKTRKTFRCTLSSVLAVGALLFITQQGTSGATLIHRYTFDKASPADYVTIKDSVGTGDGYWTNNGTFSGGDFDTYPGELNLTGSSLGAAEYVELPAGIISNYTSITIDTWATITNSGGFLWAFGNTDTNTGNGGNAFWLNASDARATICSSTPSWGTEQNARFGRMSGYVHVTVVLDSTNHSLTVYTNGTLAAVNNSITETLADVYDIHSYIAKSLYQADGLLSPIMDEMRIYDGTMNFMDVVGSDIAGPNAFGSAADIGTVTNIFTTIPFATMLQAGKEQVTTFARATGFTNGFDGAFQVADPTLCQYYSSDTNFLTVDTNGIVTASPALTGAASITTVYQGVSNSVSISVIAPSVSLTHRYDFTDDGTGTNIVDLIGGNAWNGWVVNPVGGEFGATPGELTLTAANSQYAQFPEGIISNYNTISVDMWVTCPTALPDNCFLWCFGLTDGGGGGGNAIFVQPKNGRLAISGGDPTWQAGEENATGIGDMSGTTNVHLTAVLNPVAGWEAVYVNGKLVGKNTALTFTMSQIASINNYIGKSLYTGDSLMDVTVNEYRIFDGPLTSQEVELADAAGPDAVPDTITNGPGDLLGFNVNVPAAMQLMQFAPVSLSANYQYLTNFDLIGQSVLAPVGLTVTSDNTNVLTYDSSSGFAHAVGVGSAHLIVSYQGVSTTNQITVTPITSDITLAHRYSFNETSGTTVSDSVGGAAWDGSLPNGGTFGGGQLALAATNSEYVSLPSGILGGMSAVTIDAWATFSPSQPWNSWFVGFGNTRSDGTGELYIDVVPQAGRVAISGSSPGYLAEHGAASGDWSGQTMHLTAVIDPPHQYIAIYTNGVFAQAGPEPVPLSAVAPDLAYLNRSLYTGDVYADRTVNEFRIYDGAMTPAEVAASQLAGPDQLPGPMLSVGVSGANVVISWPTNASGFTLKSKTSLSDAAWTTVGTAPVVSGENNQVTLPVSGSAQFFRLIK